MEKYSSSHCLEQDLSARMNFLLDTCQFMLQASQYADQKAFTVTVLNTTIIAGVNALGAFNVDNNIQIKLLSILGVFLLAVAIILCVWIMIPRGGRSKYLGPALRDPDRIYQNEHYTVYTEKFENSNDADLIRELCQHVFHLSQINHYKYRLVPHAFWISVVGWSILVTIAISLLLKST